MFFNDTTELTNKVNDLYSNCKMQYKKIRELRKTAMVNGENELGDLLFGYMGKFDIEMCKLGTTQKSLESVGSIEEMFRLEKECYNTMNEYQHLKEWRDYVYLEIVEKVQFLIEDLELWESNNLYANEKVDMFDGTINQIKHNLSGVDNRDLHAYFVCYVKCSEMAKKILEK